MVCVTRSTTPVLLIKRWLWKEIGTVQRCSKPCTRYNHSTYERTKIYHRNNDQFDVDICKYKRKDFFFSSKENFDSSIDITKFVYYIIWFVMNRTEQYCIPKRLISHRKWLLVDMHYNQSLLFWKLLYSQITHNFPIIRIVFAYIVINVSSSVHYRNRFTRWFYKD